MDNNVTKNITLILPEEEKKEQEEISLSLAPSAAKQDAGIELSLAPSITEKEPEEAISLSLPEAKEEETPEPPAEPAASSITLNLPDSAVSEDELDTMLKDSWRCIKCNTVNSDNYKFCTHCGTPRASNPKANWHCSHCGTLNSPQATYCRHCGRNRESTASSII
ncbi:MAG: zinc ribbon domain-containing protein [Solobacterium sp.]|nr:zinc ribbon domain-containing protein [Solobacterium sp.]